jgi:type IV secretion system protein TrbG
MKFNKKMFAALAIAASAFNVFSQASPTGISVPVPGGLDSRIRVYAYSPDVVYTLPVTISATSAMHTHVALGPDEELIEKPKLGETIQWRVSGNEKNIYIKALKAGTSTSMTLVTDKRTYQFELVSTSQPADRIQKAYFSYPDDDERMAISQRSRANQEKVAALQELENKRSQELTSQPVSMKSLSFYRVEGNKAYDRMHVFDDGKKTWLRLPPGVQDLPAVFMVGADDKLMPVNYTVVDRKDKDDRDVIIVERTSPKWLLKIGKAVEVRVSKE